MKLTRRERHDGGAMAPSSGSSSLSELNRIRNEIIRMFESPFGSAMPATSFFEGWEPSVDIYEDKDRITVKAELPGMRKEDISVSLHGDTLTLSGERKHEEEKKTGESYRAERYFGRFQRNITLPQPVDGGKIQARYEDGVLTVECPKSEESKPRQIEVKTS